MLLVPTALLLLVLVIPALPALLGRAPRVLRGVRLGLRDGLARQDPPE